MLEDGFHIHDLIQGRALPDLLSEYFQQGKILFDVGPRRGSLNFDDDTVTVFKRGPMNLCDCPGCERFRVDRLKHVLPRHPQFLLGDLYDFTLGHGRDMTLQQGEFFDVFLRKEIRTGGQHLPQF